MLSCMTSYTPTIGLEIHAELKTLTKMFCASRNDPDEPVANTHICPICMGHPGTLPTINKAAVRHVLMVGTAVGGTLADYTEFDRKNYFYPDIPKNYQISQYKYPLVSGGMLDGVELTRIHLEEDTARSTHDGGGGYSGVDYNRAGLPLMELVTEPVIRTKEQAVSFARELRLLLRTLGASDANLEKGEMRIEANISLSATDEFGTKVEVKNLNSFKAVEQAIQYEIKRQTELLSRGEEVVQETRGWDENKQLTFSQRKKENAHDYRYFPDPDLPKLYRSEIAEFSDENLASTLPELPWVTREKLTGELQVPVETAETILQDRELLKLFRSATEGQTDAKQIKLTANYIASDILGAMKSKEYVGRQITELEGTELAGVMKMVGDGTLSSRGAKDLIAIWLVEGGDPSEIAEKHALAQSSSDDEISSIIKQILVQNESVAAEVRGGKEAGLQFLVGQGMKISKGKANPIMLTEALKRELGA